MAVTSTAAHEATQPIDSSHPTDSPSAVVACGSGVVLYADPDTGDLIITPTRCHRWDCPHCAPVRKAEVMARARAGRPERIIVLTLRPMPSKNLSARIDYIRLMWRRLLQRIRRQYGPIEWMAALELQKNGTPHLHILQRGPYISQRWLSAAWMHLTGSFRVHISKIDHERGAIDECTKYLTKTASEVQKSAPGRPVYTMSRGWLPADFVAKADSEPIDPWSAHFCLSWKDALHTLERIGSTVEPVPEDTSRHRVTWRAPPTPAALDAIPKFMADTQEFALAYYCLVRAGAYPDHIEHARQELTHFFGLHLPSP